MGQGVHECGQGMPRRVLLGEQPENRHPSMGGADQQRRAMKTSDFTQTVPASFAASACCASELESYWYRAWMAECWRTLKDGGYMLIFLNWRTLPMLMKACADAKIETTSLAVWDKEWIGPSGPAQLRPALITAWASGIVG